jgi:PAS domain
MNIRALNGTDDDPDLTALYAYWTRQCGSRSMPSRADIHPKHIVSLLPEVFLADICQPLRFRFRLVGSDICERWHDDFTGKWLDELAFDGELETVIEQFSSVARTGKPRADEEEFVNEDTAYNSNYELKGAFGFNGDRPGYYGPGLVHYLNEWSNQQFKFTAQGNIRERS